MYGKDYIDAWVLVWVFNLITYTIINKFILLALRKWKGDITSLDWVLNEWKVLQKMECFMFPVSFLLAFIIFWISLKIGFISISLKNGFAISNFNENVAIILSIAFTIGCIRNIYFYMRRYRQSVQLLKNGTQKADSAFICTCTTLTDSLRDNTMSLLSCSIPLISISFEYILNIHIYAYI